MTACASVQASVTIVVDDFSSFNDTGNLLGGGNTREQNFVTTTGPGTNTITITNASGAGAGQAALLSDSFSLVNVGDRVSTMFGTPNFGSPTSTSSSFGLALTSSEAITTRENALFFYWRRNTGGTGSQLAYISLDGAGTTISTSSAITFNSLTFTPDGIFIERTATGYDLGWIQGANEGIAYSLASTTQVTADGTAVGLYSDGRNDNFQYVMNNFSVTLVPEPSTAVLFGIGLLALLNRRRA